MTICPFYPDHTGSNHRYLHYDTLGEKLFMKCHSNRCKKQKNVLWTNDKNEEEKKNDNRHKQIADFVVKFAAERHYKKMDGNIMIISSNGKTYEKLKTFKEFIRDDIFKERNEENAEVFDSIRRSPTGITKIATHLEEFNDMEFPIIEENYHQYAFRNGYLDISKLDDIIFISDDERDEESDDIIPSLYFDCDFEEKWLETDMVFVLFLIFFV